MARGQPAVAVLAFALLGAAMGYVLATAYLTFAWSGLGADVDIGLLARQYPLLLERRPPEFGIVNLIVGGSVMAALLVSVALMSERLTTFGTTRWQSVRDMKRNGFFAEPGRGFVLGKLGPPSSRKPFVSSKVFPHTLIVAPTGRGKTTGFVIPNLLSYKGSAVVLDVKGENFEATARHRASQGDKVYRFAPTDWGENRSHRYNPLLRISALKNPDQQQMELQFLASLFLQTESEKARGFLDGGIDLFVAAGMLAFERDRPTLGEIYRITASGGDKQKWYRQCADEVKNEAAKLIFVRMSSTNNDTLTSYLSLLMTSGLKQWSNPAIDRATAASDFDFRTIRKRPFSVYLVVAPLMVKPLAPLIRLVFSDLLAALQDHEPGKDEPWPVMIMLDEFNRLGKMPIVLDSIETLRSHRANLAVVTQTIPALDEIYGENARRSFQGNAGIKLYLTPSDEKTIEELSKSIGKTTKRVVTRSRASGRNPLSGRSLSERTEETPLLTEDEARRLDLDDVVMVIDGQMPVRAKRIKYYEDRHFKRIVEREKGPLPYAGPPSVDERLTALEETLRKPAASSVSGGLAGERIAPSDRAAILIAAEKMREAARDDPNANATMVAAIAALADLLAGVPPAAHEGQDADEAGQAGTTQPDAPPTSAAPLAAPDRKRRRKASGDRGSGGPTGIVEAGSDMRAKSEPAADPASAISMTIPSRKHRRRVEVERLEADSTAIDVPSMAAEVAKAPEAADAVRQAGVKVGALLADDELDTPEPEEAFVAERENATAAE